ncbi:meiosis-specific serine threonine-protein kinase MEK1 [Colletotrichum tofieldiae]|nr:meiosis-specific serine threonine-protein kinase MEK1 [Colletotrichum tofieldiae]GKT72471.1 meiosis-specific serine threonine-protein kinase MEK1 [Colletotrichum tofieldiae]
MSWGRGPSNTVIYEPKTEVKIPKYALKVLLWKDGYDPSKDPAKHPWDKYPNGEGFAFYLSTKATNGILLNGCELLSHDCKNPTSPSRNWVQIHDGDEIVVWGTATDTTSQTKVIFRCFYGDSAKPRRPDAPPKLVSSSAARKMDEICGKYERKLKTAAEQEQRYDEVDKELVERKQNIERERERSRVFEEKRLEALRYVALRTASRRGSPASAPATTVLRGQTPGPNAPSPLQEARSSSPQN